MTNCARCGTHVEVVISVKMIDFDYTLCFDCATLLSARLIDALAHLMNRDEKSVGQYVM